MAVTFEVSGGIAVVRVGQPLDAAVSELRALLPVAATLDAVVLDAAFRPSGGVRELLRAPVAKGTRGLAAEVASLPAPVVAAIRGPAFGGAAEVAMACSRRVLASDGFVVTVEGTGVVRVRRVCSAEALRTGLVDRVAPAGVVLAAAVDLANEYKCAQAERKPCRDPGFACVVNLSAEPIPLPVHDGVQPAGGPLLDGALPPDTAVRLRHVR